MLMVDYRQERRASRDSELGKENEGNKEDEKEEDGKSIDYTVISGSPGNKQQFLEDQVILALEMTNNIHRCHVTPILTHHFQCERQRQKSFSQRASLHLDLANHQQQQEEQGEEEEKVVDKPQENEEDGDVRGERKKPLSSFVTVINVPAPKEESPGSEPATEPGRAVNGYGGNKLTSGHQYNSGTYTKPRPAKRETQGAGSLGRRPLPRLPGGGRLYRRQESKESLGSVSSPLSPSSPVEGGGEAPALMLDSSSPSPPTTTTSSGRTKPEPPVRAPRAREQVDQKSLSSSEDLHLSSSRSSDLLTSSRGRPDGGEGEEEPPPPAPLDRTSKVRGNYLLSMRILNPTELKVMKKDL